MTFCRLRHSFDIAGQSAQPTLCWTCACASASLPGQALCRGQNFLGHHPEFGQLAEEIVGQAQCRG